MFDRQHYDQVPSRFLDSLDAWAKTARPTGSFLRAVLENNLFEAVGRADSEAAEALRGIVTYVNCQLPGGCWGNKEVVEKWAGIGMPT